MAKRQWTSAGYLGAAGNIQHCVRSTAIKDVPRVLHMKLNDGSSLNPSLHRVLQPKLKLNLRLNQTKLIKTVLIHAVTLAGKQ